MGLDLRLQHKMAQQLVMTPQLQQAIKLLALSHLEMADMLRSELEQNPVLEECEPEHHDEDDTGYSLSDPHKTLAAAPSSAPSPFEAALCAEASLKEHLHWQATMADLSPQELTLATYLIEEIDEDGYLAAEAVAATADLYEVGTAQVEAVLQVVQAFDPPGVGARTLRECLAMQARQLALPDPLVELIIEEKLGLLERQALAQLAREVKHPLGEVQQAVRVITSLEPKPGRGFHRGATEYITPDLFVRKLSGERGDYAITFNETGLPRLRIDAVYQVSEHSRYDEATRNYLQDKLRGASWLLKSLHMRQRTMYRVMQSILSFQRDFFEQGVGALKPLVLKDIAQDLGMHESTISRVTSNKYVHTPQGIYPLKFFFNSAITQTGGETLASHSVRSHIQRLVGAEDPRAPLSDQRLVELLREHDIEIARRTVAKYREMLKIPTSSRRKRVF